MRAVRGGCLAALILVAGCKPRVDLRSPFDEDDPRAQPTGVRDDDTPLIGLRREQAAAGGTTATATPTPTTTPAPAAPSPAAPIPIPGSGARGGQVARAELQPVLDAGPAAFLGWFETEAVSQDGRFIGWRLITLLPAGRALAGLDLVPGDILVAVNGRPLRRPDELGDLWRDLYAAGAIVAEIRRGSERFTLRFVILGPPAAPPPS